MSLDGSGPQRPVCDDISRAERRVDWRGWSCSGRGPAESRLPSCLRRSPCSALAARLWVVSEATRPSREMASCKPFRTRRWSARSGNCTGGAVSSLATPEFHRTARHSSFARCLHRQREPRHRLGLHPFRHARPEQPKGRLRRPKPMSEHEHLRAFDPHRAPWAAGPAALVHVYCAWSTSDPGARRLEWPQVCRVDRRSLVRDSQAGRVRLPQPHRVRRPVHEPWVRS
jgi:hypothetical protein